MRFALQMFAWKLIGGLAGALMLSIDRVKHGVVSDESGARYACDAGSA